MGERGRRLVFFPDFTGVTSSATETSPDQLKPCFNHHETKPRPWDGLHVPTLGAPNPPTVKFPRLVGFLSAKLRGVKRLPGSPEDDRRPNFCSSHWWLLTRQPVRRLVGAAAEGTGSDEMQEISREARAGRPHRFHPVLFSFPARKVPSPVLLRDQANLSACPWHPHPLRELAPWVPTSLP